MKVVGEWRTDWALGKRVERLAPNASEAIALREEVQPIIVARPDGYTVHIGSIGDRNPFLLIRRDAVANGRRRNSGRMPVGNCRAPRSRPVGAVSDQR